MKKRVKPYCGFSGFGTAHLSLYTMKKKTMCLMNTFAPKEKRETRE
jgi:hypothetical protein